MSRRLGVPLLQVLRRAEQGLLLQLASVGHVSRSAFSTERGTDENGALRFSVVLAVIAVIIIAGFVLSILRCLFCRR